jgi:peroxiredoxin
MKRNIFLWVVLACCVLTSCKEAQFNYTVKGEIQGAPKSSILYLSKLTTEEIVKLDSVRLGSDGSFSLSGKTEDPFFALLYLEENKQIYLLIKPEQNIRIETDFSGFNSNYLVSGSIDSELIRELIAKQQKSLDKLVTLSKMYRDSLDTYEDDKETLITRRNDKRNDIIKEHRDFTKNFIEENPGSFASLMALYQMMDPYTSVLTPEKDFTYFSLVDSALSNQYPSAEPVKALNRMVVRVRTQLEKLTPGTKAPNIALPNPEGDTILLSSLRGKYVLLDFWASWCNPCRKDNPHLVKYFNEFKNKNFTIYQVSLDKTKENWMKAIEDDNLEQWTHVSDLKYWNSIVVNLYNIQAIPSNFLLNPRGIIIAKDLRGEELQKKLNELLN